MRTPTVMIVGIVLGPCGLVLNLTSTLAPSWRTLSNIPHQPFDLVQHQGIWDICNKFQSTSTDKCNIQNTLGYFLQLPVKAAKVLMPSSLAVTLIGLVVSSLGVRCWQDIPNDLLAGLGGLLLFVSGILSLIAVSWYNYELYNLPFPADSTLQVSYCLVLGYLGSCLEIIGGISLTFSFARYCNKNRRRKAATDPPSVRLLQLHFKLLSRIGERGNVSHPLNQACREEVQGLRVYPSELLYLLVTGTKIQRL
uniref:Claudin 23 n=1 Tax=Varanus komodoensis TaxID=61221 RepID=A0A8D2JCG3_VARKO